MSLTLDQIQDDARFEADVIVFNTLRRELKKHNITVKRNKLAVPSSNYFEGKDQEHVIINDVPMYYGKTSTRGTEFKLHLDYIKVELPVMYSNLTRKYGVYTSGPSFASIEGIVDWFENDYIKIINNKKLSPAANIGILEKFNQPNTEELLKIGDFKTINKYVSDESANHLKNILTEKFAEWKCEVSDFSINRSSFNNKIIDFLITINGIQFKLEDTTLHTMTSDDIGQKLKFRMFKSVDEAAKEILKVTNLEPMSRVGLLENTRESEEAKKNSPDSFFNYYLSMQEKLAEFFLIGIRDQFIEKDVKASIVKGILHLEGIPMIFLGEKVLRFNMRAEPELRTFLDLGPKSGGREFFNVTDAVDYFKQKNLKSYKKIKPTIKIGIFENVIKFNDFNITDGDI